MNKNWVVLNFLTQVLFTFFVISCKPNSKGKADNPTSTEETKAIVKKEPFKGIIEYELIKVEHGDLIDVVFRITNLSNKVKEFQDIRQSINANLVVQRKYLMDGKKPQKKIESFLTEINYNISKDGWEGPSEVILGIATTPEKFELKAGGHKEFIILSSYTRTELEKEFTKKNCNSVLMRAEFSNPGDLPILTNEIELK